jgi:MFS family permease
MMVDENAEYPKQSAMLYFDLSVFWFALSFPWAGMITIVIQTLVEQMVGKLSDRMSEKRIVYASAAVSCVAALVFALTSSIPIAFVAAFIFGAGYGAFIAVDWAFATNLLPDHDEAKYMGIWNVAFTVPQVIAPLIGGLLAYTFNRSIGGGFGYRAVLILVIIYLAAGTAVIQPIREKVISK